jgi:predicted SAM-dependent methyltransferase
VSPTADIKSIVKRPVLDWFGTQPEPVRRAALSLWNEIEIARGAGRAARKFQQIRNRRDMKVHLGCGPELKSGWVNVDLDLHNTVPAITPDMAPETVFINYDLRRGTLPLDSGSCSYIYSAHFFEHLEYPAGARLMRDCYRVLRPGGTFRAALPTFKAMLTAYLEGNEQYFEPFDILAVLPYLEKGTETLVDHVNFGVYSYGEHKCIYDEQKVCLLLSHIGFRDAQVSTYQEGMDPDNYLRQRYSFYIEATK